MGKLYDQLDDKLIRFIEAQKMFFVATAPLSDNGHMNASPKGYDCFKVLNPTTVAYLDLGGSGIVSKPHKGAEHHHYKHHPRRRFVWFRGALL